MASTTLWKESFRRDRLVTCDKSTNHWKTFWINWFIFQTQYIMRFCGLDNISTDFAKHALPSEERDVSSESFRAATLVKIQQFGIDCPVFPDSIAPNLRTFFTTCQAYGMWSYTTWRYIIYHTVYHEIAHLSGQGPSSGPHGLGSYEPCLAGKKNHIFLLFAVKENKNEG